MTEPVQFIGTREETTVTVLKDGFELRDDQRWPWLQRVCFWILRKLGAFLRQETRNVTTFVVNPKMFIERALEMQEQLDVSFDTVPEMLLIGAQDFAELMRSEYVTETACQFSAEYHNEGRIMGLEVLIIPWMRGCIVMPRLK